MKHSSQYNFRLLQSAKIVPRFQNAPFSTQKSKKNWQGGTDPSPMGRGLGDGYEAQQSVQS